MSVVGGINDLNNALDSQDSVIIVNNFDGGLVDALDADLIQEDELVNADNCVFDDHILNLVPGSQYYGNVMISGVILSMYYYKRY